MWGAAPDFFFLFSFFFLYKSHELTEDLKEWVADIQETETAAEEAAKRGLRLLKDQVEDLKTCSDNIIDAAKSQALLTLQYGVPYLPNGSDQWRRDLEAGKSDKRLKYFTSKMTNQVATVTGVPQTVVDASIESKTGVKTGPSLGDKIMNNFGKMSEEEKEEKEESGEVEMISVEIKEKNEVKVATLSSLSEETDGEKTDGEKTGGEKTSGEKTGGEKTSGEEEEESVPAPITSEQAALLGQFRPPKQPEEYWYENHLCMFKFLIVMCGLNIVLAIVTILVPF